MLNLQKVDHNNPYSKKKLEKLKADREANERNTMDNNRSAASSVELVEEVIKIASEPITQIPESDENAISDSPLTPLALGFIPPYITKHRDATGVRRRGSHIW